MYSDGSCRRSLDRGCAGDRARFIFPWPPLRASRNHRASLAAPLELTRHTLPGRGRSVDRHRVRYSRRTPHDPQPCHLPNSPTSSRTAATPTACSVSAVLHTLVRRRLNWADHLDLTRMLHDRYDHNLSGGPNGAIRVPSGCSYARSFAATNLFHRSATSDQPDSLCRLSGRRRRRLWSRCSGGVYRSAVWPWVHDNGSSSHFEHQHHSSGHCTTRP